MKNLKKLVVIGAILGATHGAKAFEKEFEPAKNGGDQGIELINGQLMVKTEGGKVGDMDMPYTFVGTNTTNFAENGFAVKEMADTNSILLDKDNNNVYFTRSSTNGVYKMTVSDKTALNGIGKVEFFKSAEPVKVLSVKEGVIYTQNTNNNQVVEFGNIETATISSVTLPESATNNVYSVAPNGYTYVFEMGNSPRIAKYDRDGEFKKAQYGLNSLSLQDVKEMVAFDDENIFILTQKNELLKKDCSFVKGFDLISVSNITRSKDGKILLITSNKNGKTVVSFYNPENGQIESNTKPFGNTEVRANGIKYFVRNKSIGYE